MQLGCSVAAVQVGITGSLDLHNGTTGAAGIPRSRSERPMHLLTTLATECTMPMLAECTMLP